MGECACASTDISFRFPGPESVTYGIEVYRACRYCHTPDGVIIYRIDHEAEHGVDVAENYLEFAEALNFLEMGGDSDFDWAMRQAAIPVEADGEEPDDG